MASQPIISPEEIEGQPPHAQGMSQSEIAAILQEQERSAVTFRDTVIADEQANAIDFYESQPFGDEEDGRSQVIVPDVAEVVDYMQISVLRTVASGDRVVEFEPGDTDQIPDLPEEPEAPDLPPQQPGQEPNPETQAAIQDYQQAKAQWKQACAPFRKWEKERGQRAEDATEAVNYIFMRRQNGYRILLDWLQSGLIEKYGVIKTACVTERKAVKQLLEIPEEGLILLQQQGISIVQATPPEVDGANWQVVVSQEQGVKRFVDLPIPSEEYLFAPRTKDEDSCIYQAHRCLKSLSDLMEMGFDRELIDELPTEDDDTYTDQRSISRWGDETVSPFRRTPEMRQVWLLEEYARMDVDGDGIAELVKIFRVKDRILEVEEVEESPFVVWTPFPRAHRLVGNSLAEKTMDLQRVDSILLRQALDGVYQTNNPRMGLDVNAITDDTIDDLLTVRPGGIVRYKTIMPQPLYESFDIQKSLGMLEYTAGMRETRTGITRLNQGLDEDTINKTASGQAALQATGQQIEEFVARNFAEAMARLFAKKLRLMADHGNPIAIKVDGSYRRIDPSTWDREMNVAVRVGLGSGRKDQRLVYRQQLAQQQQLGLQYGLADPKTVYNNLVAMVRDANLGNPSDYWIDPDSDEYQAAQANKPPQQDPQVMKAQADAIYQQQKAQTEAEQSQAKINLTQQESQANILVKHNEGQQKLQLESAKSEQQQALAQQKAEFEAQLAQQSADRDYRIALIQEANKHELAKMSAAHAHEINMEKAKQMPKLRPGGKLDA